MQLNIFPKSQRQREIYKFCYLGLLPVVLVYGIFRIYPIVDTIRLSFYNWDLIKLFKPFVGFGNYQKLFHDQLFLLALRNTCIFAVASVLVGIVLSLALATALHNRIRSSALYQAIYFLPVITPMVPVSVIWKWIYDPGYGLLNYVLSLINIKPIGWLVYPKLALFSIVIMCIWKGLGYNMVMFLVGLKSISRQYYEAAEIDGANRWKCFRHITLPLLQPIMLFVFVTTTIDAFNLFTPVYVMTMGSQGAPGNAVRTLVFNIYEDGFRYFKMGYASSEAVALLILVLILTLFQFKMFQGNDICDDNQ
jgi:multiple sugar transport system permease protein